MRGPTEEQRAEARRAYEAGESLNSISERMNLRRQTLMTIRTREGWVPAQSAQESAHHREQVKRETNARVIDFATRRAIETIERSGAIQAQADFIASNLTLHGEIGNLALDAVRRTFDDYKAGKIEAGVNQNQADVLKSVLSAAKMGIDMTRDMAGLKSGQISHDGGVKVDTAISVNVRRLPMTKSKYDEAKSA